MPGMKFHPFADVFPLLEGDAFERFADDVKANGLREPILLADGMVADGRNRYRACLEHGVQPEFEQWDGQGSLLALVVSRNLHRRHLEPGQLAALGAKLKPMFEEEARARQQNTRIKNGKPPVVANLPPPENIGKSRDFAAKAVGVSPRLVEAASKVLKDGDQSLIDAVDSGEIAVSDAAKITSQPKQKQREAVEAVRNGQARTAAQAVERQPGEDDDTLKIRFKKESGKVAFDDRKVGEAVAKLARLFNERANALGHQKHKGWQAVHRKMDELLDAWKEWQRA